MKTDGLLIAMVMVGVAAGGAPPGIIEDIVTTGPQAGQKRVIVETVDSPIRECVLTNEATILLGPPNRRVTVPVALKSLRHRFFQLREGDTNDWRAYCYEFQIRSKETNVFIWSCWVPDFPRPHRFQVWTTESGKSYACFVQDGVHLYELRKDRQPEERRRAFWVHSTPGAHPDALPILPIDQIQQAFAPESRRQFHLNPTTYFVEVLELTDRDGELRVSVRGREPRRMDYAELRVPEGAYEKWEKARATFALRGDHWELVSTTGK
jgi:hypothetical protein